MGLHVKSTYVNMLSPNVVVRVPHVTCKRRVNGERQARILTSNLMSALRKYVISKRMSCRKIKSPVDDSSYISRGQPYGPRTSWPRLTRLHRSDASSCQSPEKAAKTHGFGWRKITESPSEGSYAVTEGNITNRAYGPVALNPMQLCDGTCAWNPGASKFPNLG